MSIDFSKINDPDEHERLDFVSDDESLESPWGEWSEEPDFSFFEDDEDEPDVDDDFPLYMEYEADSFCPSREEWEPDYCMDFMDEP